MIDRQPPSLCARTIRHPALRFGLSGLMLGALLLAPDVAQATTSAARALLHTAQQEDLLTEQQVKDLDYFNWDDMGAHSFVTPPRDQSMGGNYQGAGLCTHYATTGVMESAVLIDAFLEIHEPGHETYSSSYDAYMHDLEAYTLKANDLDFNLATGYIGVINGSMDKIRGMSMGWNGIDDGLFMKWHEVMGFPLEQDCREVKDAFYTPAAAPADPWSSPWNPPSGGGSYENHSGFELRQPSPSPNLYDWHRYTVTASVDPSAQGNYYCSVSRNDRPFRIHTHTYDNSINTMSASARVDAIKSLLLHGPVAVSNKADQWDGAAVTDLPAGFDNNRHNMTAGAVGCTGPSTGAHKFIIVGWEDYGVDVDPVTLEVTHQFFWLVKNSWATTSRIFRLRNQSTTGDDECVLTEAIVVNDTYVDDKRFRFKTNPIYAPVQVIPVKLESSYANYVLKYDPGTGELALFEATTDGLRYVFHQQVETDLVLFPLDHDDDDQTDVFAVKYVGSPYDPSGYNATYQVGHFQGTEPYGLTFYDVTVSNPPYFAYADDVPFDYDRTNAINDRVYLATDGGTAHWGELIIGSTMQAGAYTAQMVDYGGYVTPMAYFAPGCGSATECDARNSTFIDLDQDGTMDEALLFTKDGAVVGTSGEPDIWWPVVYFEQRWEVRGYDDYAYMPWSGEIEDAWDRDYFVLEIPASWHARRVSNQSIDPIAPASKYRIRVESASTGTPLADPRMWVYTLDGAHQIAENDDINYPSDLQPQVEITTQAWDQHVAVIVGGYGSHAGDYEVIVEPVT